MKIDVPEDVRRQLDACVEVIRSRVPGLVAIYLHGSICLGEFVPGKSDIDLLVICSEPMDAGCRASFADALLEVHRKPCKLELSVIMEDDLRSTPVMCQFHFSELWAGRYAAHDESNPLLHGPFPDDDIPSYIRLVRQQGIVLYGSPPDGVLPVITDEQFRQAIAADIDAFAFEAYGMFDSNILTLARILSFIRTGKIMTKVQGARWAMAQYPRFRLLLEQAVDAYLNDVHLPYSDVQLSEYKAFLTEEIRRGLG
ncbi:aminoglycoside adenylyltransferase domain-containing protein [Symbiobacterium terraclitae]|uniref:aminoglycoside adenylyltransferase domain-containing protein n=1 Tax=Symbiobacterium terraclitae TaxID=557451 RepID=UPI0035B54E7A